MQYQNIKGIDKPLSRIIYGCTTEAMMKGQNVNKLLDEIYALGINTFDTAENYGLSEVSLGNWMRERNNRDKVVVITKGCHPYDGVDRMTPEYLKQDIELSQKMQQLHRISYHSFTITRRIFCVLLYFYIQKDLSLNRSFKLAVKFSRN